jgi:short-subunit dehydrogenase
MIEMRNKSSNSGRVAVVTCTSKGIGRAIAMEFAKAGYSVVLNARTEEELERSADDMKSIKEVARLYRYPEIYHRNMLVFFW